MTLRVGSHRQLRAALTEAQARDAAPQLPPKQCPSNAYMTEELRPRERRDGYAALLRARISRVQWQGYTESSLSRNLRTMAFEVTVTTGPRHP